MDQTAVNKKIVTGFFTLTFRRIILTAISAVTINIILIQILPPSVIGVFNIANSILTFFSYFSDIGLAGALIQKKDLDPDDLTTTFVIQEILALLISLTLFIFAPIFANFYHLDPSGLWLIRALAAGFFLSSLKVMPSVLLERELNFGRLVTVEIFETLSYCFLLIVLSYNGFGVNGYSFAVLVRSVIGVITIYSLAPWKIHLKFSRSSAKNLLHFGVPFQVNSLLALLKDRLVPLVVARMVSATGMGYITWAQNISFMPLDFMSSMNRITFPAFSRIQHDKGLLKETLERSVFFTTLLIYPLLFGIMVIAPVAVGHLIKPVWRPALPLIYFFALNAFWASVSTLCTNFLYAIGKAGITLKLMIMWTGLEWLLTPVLTFFFGFIGVGIATAVISFTSIIPLLIVRKIVPVDFINNIWQQLLAAIVMALVVFGVGTMLPKNVLTIGLLVILGGCVYLLLVYLLIKEKVLAELRALRK